MTPRKQTKSGNQRNAEYRDRQQAKDKEGFLKKHAEANRKSRAKKKQEIEELRQRAEQPLAMAAVQAYELLLKDKAKEQKAVLASSGKTEKRAFNANQQIVKSGSDFRNRSLKTFAKMIGCSVSTAGAAVTQVVVKPHPTERHGNGVLAANLKDERNYSALVDSDNVPSLQNSSGYRAQTGEEASELDELDVGDNYQFSNANDDAFAETPQRNSNGRTVLQSPRSEYRRKLILRNQRHRYGNVPGVNCHWKPGTQLRLPLTMEHRQITFNMQEGLVVTAMALGLTKESIEDNVPVSREDGLGNVLTQIQDDLPENVKEALLDIWEGRQNLHHNSIRVYDFLSQKEHDEYVKTMFWVMQKLCPNWKLLHRKVAATEAETRARKEAERANREEKRANQVEAHLQTLAELNDQLKESNNHLKEKLGSSQNLKRPSDDTSGQGDGGSPHMDKRSRVDDSAM